MQNIDQQVHHVMSCSRADLEDRSGFWVDTGYNVTTSCSLNRQTEVEVSGHIASGLPFSNDIILAAVNGHIYSCI